MNFVPKPFLPKDILAMKKMLAGVLLEWKE